MESGMLGLGLFFILTWVIFYRGIGLRVSFGLYIAFLAMEWLTHIVTWYGVLLQGITLLTVFSILLIRPLRRVLFSSWVIRWVKRILPPISSTEQEAIDAGDVWLDGDIFRGNIDFKKLFSWKRKEMSQEEQAFLDGPVTELCQMIDDWKIVQQDWRLPDEVWGFLKQNKFFGLIIPKSYGGLGFSAIAHSSIVARVASKSPSAAVVCMVPNSLGPAELLMHYGTQWQKDYYLPRLASGQEIPCFALTGVEIGSDAGAMPDYGVVTHGEHEGKSVLGIRLNWNKRYITLAPVATVMGLAFKLYDPQHLIGTEEERGITLVLIPTNHPGVVIGRRHNPLGQAFPNGPTTGKDVFIPMEWVIGGQPMVGQGWRMLMECLSVGRGISLPALGAAVGHMGTFSCVAYAKVREQFKISIGSFEGIQEVLGEIIGLNYIIDAMRIQTAGAIDDGVKPSVISAISKYHMTNFARTIINHAMDIQGGKGIVMGPRNTLAHAYISIPISITVEGANILTRSLMIFGQGAIRCHPYLLKEIHSASATDGLKEFDEAFFGHLHYAISNVVRLITLGLSAGFLANTNTDYPYKRYIRRVTLLATGLSVASELALVVLGGDLKRKESLSARLGDVLSYLYMSVSVMKAHLEEPDLNQKADIVKWCLEYTTYQSQESLYAFADNFPLKCVGWVLKKMIFPYGRLYAAPSDQQTHGLAKNLLDGVIPLKEMTYLMPEFKKTEAASTLKQAFELNLKLTETFSKLRKYKKSVGMSYDKTTIDFIEMAHRAGVISVDEEEMLKKYEVLRYEVIMTDDFSPDAFARGVIE